MPTLCVKWEGETGQEEQLRGEVAPQFFATPMVRLQDLA
jgi:hypothetical protein